MQRAISRLSGGLPDEVTQYVLFFGTDDPPFPYRASLVDLDLAGRATTAPARRVLAVARRRRRLQQTIHRLRLDTLVSFGESANLYNALTSGKRTVLSARNATDEALDRFGATQSGGGWPFRFLLRRLYRRADAIVAVSEGVAESLRRSFDLPRALVRVIPNGYDAEEIARQANAPLSPEEASLFAGPTILAVGALDFRKGHDVLLHALARLGPTAGAPRLLIVGHGEARAALEADAQRLGVADRVSFLGYQDNPFRFMRRATIFALPSRFEGFPNVLVEAMLCGVAVVAADCHWGPSEILGTDQKAGLLIPTPLGVPIERAAVPLAEALASLLASPAARVALAAEARIRAERFTMAPFVSAWLREL